MIKDGKRISSKPRHGKSKGFCAKCGNEFLLKKNKKHPSTKLLKRAYCGCQDKKVKSNDRAK